jgi:hypothetical protein
MKKYHTTVTHLPDLNHKYTTVNIKLNKVGAIFDSLNIMLPLMAYIMFVGIAWNNVSGVVLEKVIILIM